MNGHGLPRGFLANIADLIKDHATIELILGPMLKALAAAIEQLLACDRVANRIARKDKTVQDLMTAPRGPIVALGFMTGVATLTRFKSSSSVGAFFGMTPRRYQSGEVNVAGGISNCGDGMARSLLYGAAKVLLSRASKPSDLQAWGQALAERAGKKKATMAVAR